MPSARFLTKNGKGNIMSGGDNLGPMLAYHAKIDRALATLLLEFPGVAYVLILQPAPDAQHFVRSSQTNNYMLAATFRTMADELDKTKSVIIQLPNVAANKPNLTVLNFPENGKDKPE